MTSLLWASLHGHVAIVQKLLDSGADVYATNEVSNKIKYTAALCHSEFGISSR